MPEKQTDFSPDESDSDESQPKTVIKINRDIEMIAKKLEAAHELIMCTNKSYRPRIPAVPYTIRIQRNGQAQPPLAEKGITWDEISPKPPSAGIDRYPITKPLAVEYDVGRALPEISWISRN